MEAIQTPEQPITTPAPSSPSGGGMFGPYVPPEIGEPIELLLEAGQFVLVSASVREGIETQHGKRTAFDMRVQTTTPNVTRLVSGFAAGIVAQIKDQQDGDLPATCEIVDQPTPRGTTKLLQLVGKLDPAADLHVVAASLPHPIAAIAE